MLCAPRPAPARWSPLLAALLLAGCDRATTTGSPPPAGDTAAVVVRLSYGSEKKAFLTDAIEAFQRSGAKTTGALPIRIEAVAEGSAESMEEILAGRSTAHVWSPASSLLVDVLNDRWIETHGGLGSARPLALDAPPLLLSPVVIALWEPMARALGWPERGVGWKDVAAFAASGDGWARAGHAEWGAFKFGHTHPRYSNSGAIALVAATYAGSDKTRDLETADLQKAADFVRRVQAGVVHYGRSTGFFAEKMFTRGPAYLSAAVLYENLVVESALDPRYKNRPFPVVAVYPKEGTFWADHPYAILELPTLTPELREAAIAFRTFLLSPERQRIALQRFGFRPADPQIALGAPIDAAHGVDPAQPRNVLPNPKVAVTRLILDRFESVKRPVSVTLVIDTSGSMEGDALRQAKAGARGFLDSLPDADSVRVLLFSSRPHWVSPRSEPVAPARQRLGAAIDASFADGGTALYDAIREACRPDPGDPRGAARAVIVLSDGEDTDSQAKLPALLAELGRANGPEVTAVAPRLFTIAYGTKADSAGLKQLAEAGGGAFYAGTPKDIRAVYAELASFF